MHPAVIEVTQEGTGTDAEATALTLQVPEDGKVHFRFRLEDQVMGLFVRVSFVDTRTYCFSSVLPLF